MELLAERHSDEIVGVLSCYDRILVQGTLPTFCYAQGMTGYLFAHGIRIFDYPRFAEPLRDQLRENAERLAAENGLSIEYIRKANFRKEDRVRARLRERGTHPGLVCIFSAMERCSTYRSWYDKKTGKVYLRPDDGKCLHYYFYFLDEDLGLVFVRVPTWCPFRLQIYFNGHEWLASQLRRQGIAYQLLDNAFLEIADWHRAQRLADSWSMKELHTKLDAFARRYCPIIVSLGLTYHWSLDQVEYSTDLVFRDRKDLQPLYETLTRTAIHTVKPENIATFLGRKLSPLYNGEMGSRFQTRIEGTRIKHLMGPVSLKMYDKFGQVLRLETTVNDVSFFQHYRQVEQRDGRCVTRWARMKKSLYSLPPCGNCSWRPTGVTWSSFRPWKTRAPAWINSNAFAKLSASRNAPTPVSTSSLHRISTFLKPSPAANTTSTAFRTRTSATTYPAKTAAKSLAFSNACACMASSRKSPTITSTTSPSSASRSSPPASNSETLSSFPNSPSLPHHDSPNPAPFGQNFTGKRLLLTLTGNREKRRACHGLNLSMAVPCCGVSSRSARGTDQGVVEINELL